MLLPPQEFLLTESPRSIGTFGEAILNLSGQIDLPITLETSHYLFTICRGIVSTIIIYKNKGQFTHRRHDTTRQHATRPVFSLPIQSNGSVHTYAASLVVTTKSCKAAATKIALEAIFVVCRSNSINKTDKENSFHKFMTQE